MEFFDYAATYGLQIATVPELDLMQRRFQANEEFLKEFNSSDEINLGVTLAHNALSVLDDQEFEKWLGLDVTLLSTETTELKGADVDLLLLGGFSELSSGVDLREFHVIKE